jgi:hypothetical protein
MSKHISSNTTKHHNASRKRNCSGDKQLLEAQLVQHRHMEALGDVSKAIRNAAEQVNSKNSRTQRELGSIARKLESVATVLDQQVGEGKEANNPTSQIAYSEYVHRRLMANASSRADESNEDNRESDEESDPNSRKSTPLIRLEGPEGAKETSTPRPTKKQKITKSNLALPEPNDGKLGEAKKISTSTAHPTKKKKATKSSRALPGPNDGKQYGKLEACGVLSGLEPTARSKVIDDWIEKGLIPVEKKSSMYRTCNLVRNGKRVNEWGQGEIRSSC